MLKFLMRLSVSVLTAVLLLNILPVHGEEEIYQNAVRLHVLAHSDAQADQELKYLVRDALLVQCRDLFGTCQNAAQAQQTAQQNLDVLTRTAERVIAENGYDYPCSVCIGTEHYPTREYGEMVFPAGDYISLRVLIGDAAGKNWWCVLFPPLCLDAASDTYAGGGVEMDRKTGDMMYQAGFTPGQVQILTEAKNQKTVIRFKLLEVFSGLFS